VGWAQPDTSQLEEVVVTARRVQERLQDVPVAVTVLSSEQLRANNVTTIKDLQSQAPSLFITTGGGGTSTASVGIRAQTQADTLLTTEPSVAVYVDNVPLPRQVGLRANLFDIDRVQVLKGSQGTLFGKNTTGGAVLFSTKSPSTRELGGYMNVAVGNYNYSQLSAAFNYPVIDDMLGVRVAAQKTKNTGFGRTATGEKMGNLNNESVRLSMLFTPTENIELRLSADNTRSRGGGNVIRTVWVNPIGLNMNGLLSEIATELGLRPTTSPENQRAAYDAFVAAATAGGARDNTSVAHQFGNLDVAGVMGDFSIRFSGLTFRSISGHRWINREDLTVFDTVPFHILRVDLFQDDKSFTQELQLFNESTSRLSWIIGGYYNNERGHEGQISTSLFAINPTYSRPDFIVSNKSVAAFAQANFDVTRTLRLTGGIRYSKVKQEYIGFNRVELPVGNPISCAIPPVMRTPGQACQTNLSTSAQDPSYLASVDWKPSSDVMIYAKTASSFRGGGINPRGNATSVNSYDAFKPEKTTDYEVGLKGDFLERRLRVNAAAFLTNYRGIQRSTITFINGAIANRTDNAAKATVKGVELELTAKPMEQLTLNASGSVVDPKYDEFADASGDRSHEAFPVPKTQFSFNATYAVPTQIGDVTLYASYRRLGKVVYNATVLFMDSVTQPAYELWDGRVSMKLRSAPGAELAVFAKNITNKTYITQVTGFDRTFGFNTAFPGEPRTYGVELRYSFGGG
jgi:iron complex outermembrane receptor protein